MQDKQNKQDGKVVGRLTVGELLQMQAEQMAQIRAKNRHLSPKLFHRELERARCLLSVRHVEIMGMHRDGETEDLLEVVWQEVTGMKDYVND